MRYSNFEQDARLELMSELMEYVIRRHIGDRGEHGGAFGWLRGFDDDDVRSFAEEIRVAFRDACAHAGSWDAFDALLHEWRESAIRPASYLAELKKAPAVNG